MTTPPPPHVVDECDGHSGAAVSAADDPFPSITIAMGRLPATRSQDIVFAGAGEDCCWQFTAMFDAMGALSTQYNDSPETASRAFDKTRDG